MTTRVRDCMSALGLGAAAVVPDGSGDNHTRETVADRTSGLDEIAAAQSALAEMQ